MKGILQKRGSWSWLGVLLAGLLLLTGCFGGGGNDNVLTIRPSADLTPIWSTTLEQVQQAIRVSSGTIWVAGQTSVTLNFSEDEARTFCGLIDDPVMSSFTASLRAGPFARESVIAPASGSFQVVLPARFSWLEKDGWNWATPIKSQGKYGTCVAFAALGAMETGLKIARNQATASFDLSEWYLWYQGTGGKNPNPGGWYPSAAANFLKTYGTVNEEYCPYSSIPNFPTPPTDATRFRISDWAAVSGRDAIKQALMTGPVMVAMTVRTDFFYYKSGIYSPTYGTTVGDHAILLIGYDDTLGCWIGKNSWSTYWGEEGFFRIRYGAVNEVGIQFSITAQTSTLTGTGTETSTGTGTGTGSGTGTSTDTSAATGTTTVTATSTSTVTSTDTSTATATSTATSTATVTGTGTGTGTPTSTSVDTGTGTGTGTAVSTVPVITGPFVRNITATSAEVFWATDQESTSPVEFGTTTSYSRVTPEGPLTKSHIVQLEELSANTTYHFRVSSKNSAGLVATSTDQTFKTLDPSVPAPRVPIISGITITGITSQTAVIAWQTDLDSSTQVQYTAANGSTTLSPLDQRQLKVHSVTLKGLQGGTNYSFFVKSKITGEGEAISDPDFFTTIEITPPVINPVNVDRITATSASVVWLTNEPSTTQIEYGLSQSFGNVTALVPTLSETHQVNLTGLTPQTIYYFRVRSKDAYNNEAISGTFLFTTSDAIAPTLFNIQVASLTGTTALISFTTSESAIAAIEYGIGSFTQETVGNTTGQTVFSIPLTGLTPLNTYKYRVRARDLVGNETLSTERSFTTPDTNGPVVYGLTLVSVSSSSATISWTTDENGTTQLEIGNASGVYASATAFDPVLTKNHQAKIIGLSEKTTYHVRARALDVYGYIGVSENFSFTTPDQKTPDLIDIRLIDLATSTVTVVWETSEPARSIVDYGLTTGYGSQARMFPYPASMTTSHVVPIPDLTPFTQYHMRVRSTDAAGNEAISKDLVFTTLDTAAPAISGVATQSVTGSGAVIAWLTDKNSSTIVQWGTASGIYAYEAVGSGTLSRGHSVSLTGLQQGVTYHFRVKSVDASGREAVSGNYSFTTPDTTAPAITTVLTTNLTNTSVLITWRTDEPSTSQVEYGLTASYTQQTSVDMTATTTHGMTLTKLSGLSIYNFRVRSVDASGNETISKNYILQTSDPTPPEITEVLVQSVTNNSATIVWNSDESSDTQVEYSLLSPLTSTFGATLTTNLNGTLTRTHSATLVGLTENATYSFIVRSKDLYNNLATSPAYLFFTPDKTSPVVTVVVATVNSSSAATITWGTNEPATSYVEYGSTTSYGSGTPVFPDPTLVFNSSHSVALSGLKAGVLYHFRIRSRDAVGNETVTKDYTFLTTDIVAPIISDILVQNITANTVTILWNTDENSDTQLEYSTGGGATTTTTLNSALSLTHTVSLSGLLDNATYSFRVRSRDQSGNLTVTAGGQFTTLDKTGPVQSLITATVLTANTASITLNTNEAAIAVVEYGLTTSYGSETQTLPYQSATATSHVVSLAGLKGAATYNFRVKSTDVAGNQTISKNYTFTTLDNVAPVISAISFTGITATSATILWTTDELSDSLVAYGTTTAYGSTTSDVVLVKNHSLTLYSLTEKTTYNFAVRSTDASGNIASLSNFVFTTADRTAPMISSVTVAMVWDKGVTVTWNTDEEASAKIEYGLTTTYGTAVSVADSYLTSHSLTFTGLSESTVYHFRVRVKDRTGNERISGDFTFTTTDSLPVLTNIIATPTMTGATIGWSSNKNADSYVLYGTASNALTLTAGDTLKTATHTVSLTGLQVNTTYYYQVKSTDATGKTGLSAVMSFQTSTVTNFITSLTVSPSATSATLNWLTSKPADTQVAYGVTTGATKTVTLSSLTTNHSITLTDLENSQVYYYRVSSKDAQGNTVTSPLWSFTTTDISPLGSVFVYWPHTTGQVTGSQATLVWETSNNAVCKVRHGVTTAATQTANVTPATTPNGLSHTATIDLLEGAPLASGTPYYYVIDWTETVSNVTGSTATRTFWIP